MRVLLIDVFSKLLFIQNGTNFEALIWSPYYSCLQYNRNKSTINDSILRYYYL